MSDTMKHWGFKILSAIAVSYLIYKHSDVENKKPGEKPGKQEKPAQPDQPKAEPEQPKEEEVTT